MNLAALIRRHALGRPHHVAIEFGVERFDYARLWRAIAYAAADLAAAGVAPGSRVALALRDHPGHVTAHFAVAALGAVLVPIDHRWSVREKLAAADAFGVDVLLHDHDADPVAGVQCLAWNEMPRTAGEPVPAHALHDFDDDDWLISLSSGSTGKPKAALVTQRQMHERFVTQWVSLGFSSTDRFALVTPLHFGAGRSFAMSCLAAGATLILAPPPRSPAAIVAAINEHRATAAFLVPSLMRRLLEVEGDAPLLGGLARLLISGEAFFADEVAVFVDRLCPRLVGYYASSEGGGISVLQPEDFATHGATVGQAAYGVELELVDRHGRAVATGDIGRVRYRGPGVTTRGLDEHGAPTPAAHGGWFYPGDLGCRDEAGYLTLRGREKDVIVRAGVNVYPAEIENVLCAHDAVNEAAVVGVSSATHGESVIAFVAGRADATQLASWCAGALAPYKCPAAIHVLDALPRTPAGKTDKRALKARATNSEGE